MLALGGRGARTTPEGDDRSGAVAGDRPPRSPGASPLLVVVLGLVVALPLLVAVVVVRRPQWYPLFELAMTELKVRDVGSSNPPLVGLSGRIGTFPDNGNHPGPLAYWFLWPAYRAFGASSWALVVATVFVHVSAMVSALWLARRRGGAPLAVAIAAVIAVIVHDFGTTAFIEPWNPYLPALWWLVFLLGAWSALCRDLRTLPLTVFAGSLCAQTHLPYLVMTVAIGSAVVAAGVVAALAGRRRPDAGPAPAERSETLRWLAGAGVLGVVLWLPPLIDQLTREPGNIRRLFAHFGSPKEEMIGLREGAALVLERLDVITLLTGQGPIHGWTPELPEIRGAVLLVLWVGAIVLSWRRGESALLRLHGLLALCCLLSAVTASRIFGGTWNYLVMWMWAIGALVALATAWSYATALLSRLPPDRRRPAASIGIAGVAAVAVVWSGLATVDAADAEMQEAVRSTQIGEVAPETAAAVEAAGPGRYLVSWSDPTYLSTQGWGLLLELERRGLDVAIDPILDESVGRHRVARPDEVDGFVHLAVGPTIDRFRAESGAVEVAATDRADAELRAERRRLLDEVAAGLRSAGLDDLAEQVLEEPAAAAADPRFPADLAPSLERVHEIGYPIAVFLLDEPFTG